MNDNFIIISFPRYAGGKFISNCLSLSKFCCPQDPVAAEYLLTSPADYDYRLNAIMNTLPLCRAEMTKWIDKYEFGDTQLYQQSISQWRNGIDDQPNALVTRLLKSEFRLFLTAHGGDIAVQKLLKVWPNSTIIKLINHTKFSEISRSLKSTDNKSLDDHAGNYCRSKYLELAGESWPTWDEFESVGYDIRLLNGYESVKEEILDFYNCRSINNKTLLFDVDNTIFNRTKFLAAIENLYKQLSLTDYNSELVEVFWQSYMLLHIDDVDIT